MVAAARAYASPVPDDRLRELAAGLATDARAGRLTAHEAERQLGRLAFDALLGTDALTPPDNSDARTTGRSPSTGEERLAAVIRHLAHLEDEDGWKPAPKYDSVALAVLDSIWSIGVKYTGVLNVIARYTAARLQQGADPRQDTPEDLLSFIGQFRDAHAFADAVRNRQRTSSKSGILKAEAVLLGAEVMAKHGVRTPENLRALDRSALDALEQDWRQITGQGSGLSYEYLLMLCGISGVKADRHIRRFVAEALGAAEQHVSAGDARALVTACAEELGIDARVADFAIWNEMSARAAGRSAQL